MLAVYCSYFLRTNQIVVQGRDRLRLNRLPIESISTSRVVAVVVDILRLSFLLLASGRSSISGFRSSVSYWVDEPFGRRSGRWGGCQLKRFLVLCQLLKDVIGELTSRWIRLAASFEVIGIFSGPDFLTRQAFSGNCETDSVKEIVNL